MTTVSHQHPQAIDGRRLGRRAQLTRRKLLDATADLLHQQGILELKVVDVARSVGTSPATFYQYFQNVDEAVLALAEEVAEETHHLTALIDEPWTGRRGLELARQLVDGFVSYWDAHRAVLRTRNLAAEEGDQRFRKIRVQTLSRITDPLAAKIKQQQDAGRVSAEMTPYAAASAMVAMMERMAAYHFDLEPRGLTREAVVETVSRIVYQTVTGRRA